MKSKYWILLFAVLLAVGTILSVVLLMRPGGTVARIYRDGVLIETIDLASVKEAYEMQLDDDTVLVEPGRICVIRSVCPDHVCEKTGWIGDRSVPIVCLPHRLVIRVDKPSSSAIDAVAQ